MELVEGMSAADRQCVCGSLLQHHVVKSLLVSTRR